MHFIRLKGLRLLIKIANTTTNNTTDMKKQYITVFLVLLGFFTVSCLSGQSYLIESSAALVVLLRDYCTLE
jgi:uncharacterized membrane protein SpoIIM required for sporulation